MQRATVAELGASPVGRYVAGDTFAHFCAAPTLWGLVLWGRPDAAQALLLGRSLVRELRAPAMPHASIFDASRLTGVDPAAFAATERYVRDFHDALAAGLTRLALIRPPGLSGAVIAGAFAVLPRPFPVEVFDDARAAFAWLGASERAADWPGDGAQLIAQLYVEASDTPALLARLRATIEAHLADATVRKTARALGLSERTLQRKLGELGTTYQDELGDARVRAAKRLLADTDAPITNIALDIGCGSLQHLSALFRKRELESPTAYRKRQRP